MARKKTYTPRNDFVLCEIINLGESEGGVAIPEISEEGKKVLIVAAGPLVTDLHPGMEVLVVGTPGEDVVKLPGERNLVVTKQANVLVTVKRTKE